MSKLYSKSQCAESRNTEIQIIDYDLFDPRLYVDEYYTSLGAENQFLLKFYHSVYKNIKTGVRILEFGGGPTIYQLLSAAEVAGEIIFADYLQCNRDEILLWLNGDPNAINWDNYIDYVLQLNRTENVKPDHFRKLLKQKLTSIIECDANLPNILGKYNSSKFDLISTAFCLDCVCSSEDKFITSLKRLSDHLKPGGTLLISSLIGAISYTVGDLEFSAYPITEENLRNILIDLGYKIKRADVIDAEREQGYEGLIAVEAELAR